MPPWRSSTQSTLTSTRQSGAFTQVNARKTLGGKTQTTKFSSISSQPPPANPGKTKFPQKLKDYVARTFENIDPDIKEEVEKELKSIITDAFDRDIVWTVDWDKTDLPQVKMMKRKQGVMDSDSDTTMVGDNGLTPGTWKGTMSLKKVKTNNGNGLASSSSISSTSATYGQQSTPQSACDSGNAVYSGSSQSPGHDSNNKKRKSFSDNADISNVSPTKFDKRSSNKTEKDYTAHFQEMTTKTSGIDLMKDKRAKRFEKELQARNNTPPWKREKESQYSTPKADILLEGPVVGHCMELEKKYFRLTSAPDPAKVRPLHVLEKALDFLKKKWRTENNYSYVCDQLKSVRQDLTVQHIKNDFTINVYEIHARIALEKGDLGEYNQCQSQLHVLYEDLPGVGHPNEFKAYRILYLLHTRNQTDMGDLLAGLTQAEKEDANIQHALAVRSVMAARNYHRFFRLYLDCPNMGCYLMDSFVERERLAAMEVVCKAYRNYVDLRFLTEELGFESDSECAQFLTNYGAGDYLIEKKDDSGTPTGVKFNCPPARLIFTAAMEAAFKKVDIKGQI